MKKKNGKSDRVQFINQFLSKPTKVGAVLPSSKFLTKKILSFINFKQENLTIVEYGPGTGPFTKEIIKSLKQNDRLIVVEQNKKFVENLKNKFGNCNNVSIIHGSVANVSEILEKENVKKVDFIVSGIPFTSLPADVTDEIMISTAKVMSDNSRFLTFQYSTFKLRKFSSFFKIESKKFVLRNIPSAYVICMKNK